MSMTSGTRLGPYEIIARLGAGGMGEVWSARDTRLDRSVAVKILSAELARDAQFRLRLEREARTISQLSHPNICTLFDVGEDFLVMELLEGETLADRIARGPLPMPDVLRFGLQIAEALGKAHRMGIVHRDLKPANVMITKAGAKLLDFGLAKSSTQIVNVDGATQQKALTQEGTILGTFQYMAPEQLEGQDADARTDIFALGALLYEMATGHRAFEGKTKTSLIAQIVSVDPKPLRDIQPLTPPAFEHVVERCLNKDPEERWQSAQDIAEELRWTATGSASASGEERRRSAVLPWAVAATVLFAAIAAMAMILLRRPASRIVWSDIGPPRDVRLLGPMDRGGSAISPAGNRIALVGQDKQGVSRLFVRELSDGNVRAVQGTEGASFPFWSPDSRSVAFFADGKLKRIDVDGTQSAVIAADVDGRGGTWSPDGTIIFSPSSTSGLSRVRAMGGKVQVLAKLAGDQSSLRFPWMLPDGKHFLYVAMGGPHNRGVHVASIDGKVNRRLFENSDSAVFTAGVVVFLRDGALFAQGLDLDALQLRGEPRQIASGVSGRQNLFAYSGLSASSPGDVLFPAEFSAKTSLVWRDRAGAILQSLAGERMFSEPSFSPDEKRIAVTSDDPPDSLWEVDVERGRARRLSAGDTPALTATWSRDGKRIFVQSTSGGRPGVAAVPASGGAPQMVATTVQTLYPETVSPDGTFLVLDGPSPDGKDFDLWMLSLGDGKAVPFVATPANELRTQFSPDGRFFSYTSDETGRPEIFVQTWPPSENRWQVTLAGGNQAFWSGDGKELFYLASDGKLMAVAVQLGPNVSFSDPVVLFQTPLTPVSMTGNRNQYLVTRDGRRFLLLEWASSAPTRLTLVQNFPLLLEKNP
jgi:Tol biopolymer transport system component/predicted Ser/Thr protein kinase